MYIKDNRLLRSSYNFLEIARIDNALYGINTESKGKCVYKYIQSTYYRYSESEIFVRIL